MAKHSKRRAYITSCNHYTRSNVFGTKRSPHHRKVNWRWKKKPSTRPIDLRSIIAKCRFRFKCGHRFCVWSTDFFFLLFNSLLKLNADFIFVFFENIKKHNLTKAVLCVNDECEKGGAIVFFFLSSFSKYIEHILLFELRC